MYGMVNKSLEDMVTRSHGEEAWERIREAADVDIEVFVSNEGYPDEMTYRLVGAASRILEIPADQLLQAFGRHWVLVTAREGYGQLLEAGGSNLQEFLRNLPNFHARLSIIMPHLEPPRFVIEERGDNALLLHYYSRREGLSEFVRGLLFGLSEMFSTPVEVEHTLVRDDGADHDEFHVQWTTAAP